MNDYKNLERNAIQLDERDNVAITLRDVKAGEFLVMSSEMSSIQAIQNIPFGHKVSLRKIPVNGKVLKYGEWMGVATEDVLPGYHVHVSNVRGLNEAERTNFSGNKGGEII